MALVDMFRRQGSPAQPVLRGVAECGTDSVIRTSAYSGWANSPLIIEVIDSEDHINKGRGQIDAMMGSGLITMESVRVTRSHEARL